MFVYGFYTDVHTHTFLFPLFYTNGAHYMVYIVLQFALSLNNIFRKSFQISLRGHLHSFCQLNRNGND